MFEINIVTHTKHEMCCNLIKQFRDFLPRVFIRVWDNSPTPNVYPFADEVRHHRFNPSLSRVWNWSLAQSVGDWVMISNEDIRLEENWFVDLVRDIEDNPHALWHGPSRHFLMHRKLIERVGWFDERLTGFTFEDLDYIRRMNHEGVSHRYGPLSSLNKNAVSLKEHVHREMDACANAQFMSSKYEIFDTEYFFGTPLFPTPDFYPARPK